ncbi:putative DNA-binding protein [Rhodococcus wratislaviensis NBRC 100605]|uniref:Putative DNA-binding protein n=1 Tax=Rhodococcus wratislaviensis NBRC 100605 TaxID=1219028 RepID=X0PY02_RHOWR|nr:putative DNA-binding protein [Rhodococcus wratislaviensis NBRC 100605]
MDSRGDIREFPTTRRARLTPEQAGLPNFGGRRRVPGLRREEVALLAEMTVEYYVRLERGNTTGVSEAMLDGISRALQLVDAEHLHLYDLVRAANQSARPRQRREYSRQQGCDPACNRPTTQCSACPSSRRTGDSTLLPRTASGSPSSRRCMPGRSVPSTLQQTVALLRTEARRAHYDRALSDLVGEVSTRSELFRTLWASHDVREHRTGTKRIHHPIVGDLELNYEGMNLTADRGLLLLAYSDPPGSPSQERLQLLASWAATSDQTARVLPAPTDTTDTA